MEILLISLQTKNSTLHLLPRYELLLAAASGGMDSMCLLDFLYENGYRVCAAHYNHQLRGQEADMDEDLVRAWCAARRIPLCVGTGDVAAYAGENGLPFFGAMPARPAMPVPRAR